MKLYFVRHGESYANVDSSFYYKQHDHEIEITEKGKEQSRSAANKLSLLIGESDATIVYSPFMRTRQTAEIIDSEFILRGKFCDNYECPLLYERSWGNLREIVDSPKLDKHTHFSFFYRPLNGESFADTYVRVCAFMQNVKDGQYGQNDLIIVTHGEWIRLALMYIRRYSVEYFNKNHNNPNNGCVIVEEI